MVPAKTSILRDHEKQQVLALGGPARRRIEGATGVRGPRPVVEGVWATHSWVHHRERLGPWRAGDRCGSVCSRRAAGSRLSTLRSRSRRSRPANCGPPTSRPSIACASATSSPPSMLNRSSPSPSIRSSAARSRHGRPFGRLSRCGFDPQTGETVALLFSLRARRVARESQPRADPGPLPQGGRAAR